MRWNWPPSVTRAESVRDLRMLLGAVEALNRDADWRAKRRI